MGRGVLTFDIGTSSVKAGLFDRDSGEPVWQHREPLVTGDAPEGQWESERWVRAVQACTDRLPGDNGIEAVALSGNGPTIVPVGKEGAPLDQSMLWMDKREKRRNGEPSFFLPKIAWLRDERPDLYERVWQFMTCPEYIGYLLTSVSHTTTPTAEFAPYVWTEVGTAAYGIDPAKLPVLVRSGEVVGRVDRRGAELFGIPEGVPLVAGGPDFLMSLIGTDTTSPGRTCDRAGTSEGINHCAKAVVDSPAVRCLPHAIPGLYNVAGVLSSTGRIFEWFRRISRQRSVGYERMLSDIVAAGFEHEPYFFPSVHEGAAWEFSRGLFVGLRSDHATAEMGRGVVYSIGYAVRQSIASLCEAGCAVRELRACGGQAKNAIWNQMKADITGIQVSVPAVVDAELLGCYCCGRVGLGDYADVREAAGRHVEIVRQFEPDQIRARQFTDGYERYLRTYQRYVSAIRSADASSL